MFPGQCVVARLELAQTQKRPAGGLVRELDELRESRLRIRVAVGIVIERAEVKPAFGPFGLEFEGLWHVVGVARGGGLPGEFVEGSGAAGSYKCDAARKQAGPTRPLPAHHYAVWRKFRGAGYAAGAAGRGSCAGRADTVD